MKLYWLIASLLCSAAVCKAQLVTDSILVENHYRVFHYNNVGLKPGASIVFILHGSGGNGLGARKSALALESKTLAENIMMVYPDGYKNFWNECRRLAQTAPNIENINEEAFFEGMISYFNKKYKTNSKKVFIAGTSGGGHMAYKLALTIPQKITAIAAIIANLPDSNNMDCTAANKAVPVLIVNGTQDDVNPYNGGEVKSGNLVLGTVVSTDSSFAYWAGLAGYSGKPVKKMYPDTNPTDGKTIEAATFKSKGKPEVTLLKVIGGRHDYPGDIDVFVEAWSFFKRQISTKK